MSKQFAEFRVGDLFDITPTKWYKNNPVIENEILTPQVSNTTQPNGITSFEKYPANNDGNVITFSDTTVGGETLFYQPVDFIGYSHVQKMTPIGFELNQRKAHYIISSFRKAVDGKFNYAAKFNRENASNTLITLPVTDDTIDSDSPEPDWEYMESYIKEIEQKYLETVEQYNRKNEDILDALHPDYHGEEPEAYDYAEFRVGELFEITPTKWYKNNPVVEEELLAPQVSNTTQPNGITSFEKYPANNDGNVITFSDTTVGGETLFYQPVDFIGYSHVQKMTPIGFELNQRKAHYIISSFRKAVDGKFNYAAKFNRENASNTLITLPVTSDGKPDWVFMEDYISFIEGGEKRNRKLRAAQEESILKKLIVRN